MTFAPKLGRGFIASGNTSTVKMFDLKTMESLADISAGNGPDGALFELTTERVFALNHRSETLTVIDAKAGKAIENIELGGHPEFPVRDCMGKILTTLPIGPHVDATAFDPDTKLIFNANNAGQRRSRK